ncbi:MAG: FAD-dependent oxidoreductase [Bacteroidetes bacterium]|jgi:gamma-glutamylputrescine oxidase|nr:FAD-dependent oxidoreductase [Bacteroidota bacterium]
MSPQTSIYETELPQRPRYGALQAPLEVDVAIIGGGLTGISAALTLAEAGFQTAVLEAGQLGAGGSGRNGGHVCQGWPTDFIKIQRQLTPQDADIAWQSGMAAVDLLKDRVTKYNIDCDLTFGYLHAALHKRQMTELDEMQDEWEARGYAHFTRLGDAVALGQHIGSTAYYGGLYDTGCGQIQPLKYLHGLALAAVDAGAQIYENSPVASLERGAKKTLQLANGHRVRARIILLCGNAYLDDIALPQMRRRLAEVTSSVLATAPLSQNMVVQLLPSGAAVADCNAALNYYRIDADRRMIFGGRASYSKVEFGNVRADLSRRMTDVFPLLDGADIDQVWSGKIGITVNRVPHFGRTDDDVYFVQGFSGHGVALTGQAGFMLAKAVIGDATQFDVMSSLSHKIFPGGPLRTPALALAMTWFKLRDRLKL